MPGQVIVRMFIFLSSLMFGIINVYGTAADAQKIADQPPSSSTASIRQAPDVAFKQIKRKLNQSLEDGDNCTAAMSYSQLGELYFFQAAYLQALDNYYKAETLLKKQGKSEELARVWIKIGETNFYTKQYSLSLEAFEQALGLYKSITLQEGLADAYAHIGQVYEKQGDLEEAKRYQWLALGHLRKGENEKLEAKIYENIGSVFEDKLLLDSALFYFQKSLNISSRQKDKMSEIEIINNLGDVFRKTGAYTMALSHTFRAASMAEQLNEPYQLASAYRDLAKTFSLMKQYDSAFHYSEAGREIHAAIYSADNAKQLTILQTLFELEQKDAAITRYERERKIHYILFLFAVAIVILLVFLGISIFSRQRLKMSNQKALGEQNKKLFETEKHAMETQLHNEKLKEENLRNELELKGKELTSHTLHLIQKNQLLEELREKLQAIVKSEKRDQRKDLKQLLNLIQLNNNQDKNWDDFRIIFERVHEHFFDSLKMQCDVLTGSDLRLSALLKMNLSSADIATMLGISQDSLRIARYRLRKKLNLPEGESLAMFIQRL